MLIVFLQFICIFFLSFWVRGTFFCDSHQLIEIYNNVSGIFEIKSQNRNTAHFVMQFIINWSSLTKSLIDQEPFKIKKICDTFIFVILQTTHPPNIM